MEGAKKCGRCNEVKPEGDFNRLRNGRQHWCRQCFRDYFRGRGDLHRKQSGAALRRRQARLRDYVVEHLSRNPCADCGERDLRVLDFDHVGSKTCDISQLCSNGLPIEVLAGEIAECEVVCANCHRRRTATRAGWWRLTPTAERTTGRWRQRRNVAWVYEQLQTAHCVDCGVTELVLLEFDHVGTKRNSVMSMAWSEYSLAALRAEIAECEVRCCNCHRRRTAERRSGAA